MRNENDLSEWMRGSFVSFHSVGLNCNIHDSSFSPVDDDDDDEHILSSLVIFTHRYFVSFLTCFFFFFFFICFVSFLSFPFRDPFPFHK